jgi:eukaryotic translation initiation factor 2C
LPVVDLGSKEKNVWVPAELCEIEPGSIFRGKLNEQETAQMIRYACNIPRVNAEHITGEGFPMLGLSPLATPAADFGISVAQEMAVVPARELTPPRLNYRVGQPRVNNGAWNILDVKFHRGANIRSWWVLIIRDGQILVNGPQDERLQTLVKAFYDKMTNSGMTVPPGRPRLVVTSALPPVSQDPGRRQALATIKKSLQDEMAQVGSKPGFVLVLLSKRDNYIYPGIKVCSQFVISAIYVMYV